MITETRFYDLKLSLITLSGMYVIVCEHNYEDYLLAVIFGLVNISFQTISPHTCMIL